MVKNTITKLLMILYVTMLSACSFEASSNGDLDGYWHIEQIEDLQAKTIEDTHSEHRFWAVQNHLLLFRNTNTNQEYLLRFKHEGKTLTVSEPYKEDRTDGDKPMEDPAELFIFGCRDLKVTYNIEGLNSSYMTLSDGTVRIKLRKL